MAEKYRYSVEQASTSESRERIEEVPIIDVVRHGPTAYKELVNQEFSFDPEASDFALDEKHLDLTQAGINMVRETSRQLIQRIDPVNEVVLIVSSPSPRAQSTARIIDSELRAAAIPMLLPTEESVRTVQNLRQIQFRNSDDAEKWIEAGRIFSNEDAANRLLPPDEFYGALASRMGIDVEDLFTENLTDVSDRFNRFIRHASNIYRYLRAETKNALKNKKLRIIATTHGELPAAFLQNTFKPGKGIERGQILELRPQNGLVKAGDNTIEIQLLPLGEESQHGNATIAMNISNTHE